jgi:hypothetical protein
MNRREFLKYLRGGAGAAAVASVTLVPSLWERFLGLFRSEEKKAEKLRQKKSQIIAKYLDSAEGRSKLAQSMIAPLRARRDYASIGRKCFIVEPLPNHALPRERRS